MGGLPFISSENEEWMGEEREKLEGKKEEETVWSGYKPKQKTNIQTKKNPKQAKKKKSNL